MKDKTWSSSVLLPGHRTLYIGVHVPLGRRSHRRHRHHGHRHRKRSKERDSSADDGHESPSHSKCPRWTLAPISINFLFLLNACICFFFPSSPDQYPVLPVSHWLQQTHQLRGCSFSWGQRTAMRNTSRTLCSPSWTKSVSGRARTPNGKRQPGWSQGAGLDSCGVFPLSHLRLRFCLL